MKLDTNPQSSNLFFDIMDQRAIFKQRKAQSNAIVIKRQYLERAKYPQEMDSLLWITACKRDGISINKIIGF